VLGRGTETEVKEHGCVFRLDVRKTYFSPRESTERQRIAERVRPGETIMVMFSGVAPFAITIAKRQPKVGKVYAVEINPEAHESALENVRINKVGDKVVPICGDVRKECVKLYGKCNRVIMPLPKEGHKFLPTAIKCLKKGGTIHFYYVGMKDNLFQIAIDVVKTECKKLGKKARITGQRKVLPYGPGSFKVCIEFKVE
jgi:tRNA (guanine37-N1)-methyltransferase